MMSRRWRDFSVTVVNLMMWPQSQAFMTLAPSGKASRRRASRTTVNMGAERPSELAGSSRAAFLKTALGGAAVLATIAVNAKETLAFELALPFTSKAAPELEKVAQVADYSRFVTRLEQDLAAGALKGGQEDSAVVVRVLEGYLKPMQEAMLRVAPVMQLAGREARDRVRLLPLIMQGHLLELEMACGTKNAKEQLQEVQEVRETLDEFIALAKTRYEIPDLDPVPAPEGDQLGIFGCSFYGMKRTDGSSICQPDP